MLDMFIIDAFAERPLEGNPAAVCPLDGWIDDELMQSIAQEMNLSETVFFAPAGDDYEIRWFTPTREVDMIGHATLAAGHLVLERFRPDVDAVRFLNPCGEMTVSRSGEALALAMPALRPQSCVPPRGLAEALGRQPESVLAAKHYLCVFAHENDVAVLQPDMRALSELDLPAVIVTAPAPGGDSHDFVSRFFAPANGVPEDSVSGVAHLCLAPYWSERLGKPHVTGLQLSQRRGIVVCEDHGERVTLSGHAVVTLEGRICIPAA